MAESIACRGMVKIAGQNGEARKVGLIGCGKVQHSEEKRGIKSVFKWERRTYRQMAGRRR